MKRWLYLLMTVLIVCAALPAAAQDSTIVIEAVDTTFRPENQLDMAELSALNGGNAVVYTHDDVVTFVSGTCSAGPVQNVDDAAQVVLSMLTLLGGDERTQFLYWRTLTDTNNNIYYVFQQIYAGTTVSGGAVKVITNSGGQMIALSSSLESNLPDVNASNGITSDEAERIVLEHAAESGQTLYLIGDSTDKIILPEVTDVDDEDEGENEGRFVWVVYSDNPDASVSGGADFPYLAHYVTMDGVYLYSLGTNKPGDRASLTGFDAIYVFQNKEPVDYSKTVTLSNGETVDVRVTLMRDPATGTYYLGNIEREIAVADCWEFLYNHGNLVITSSKNNNDWDDSALLAFYNYCRVWDYYKEIGWIGGDGRGTPILILNDYCDSNHNQVNNAAFMGNYLGWSLFAASIVNDYSQCVDVIAHEFTHCVTGATMTYNSYVNDYGAINEAMSDIQGQICDIALGAIDDTEWILGDNSSSPVRSMSDPHQYNQPEYTWDLYYKPTVKTPTVLNDYGGVHTNSSLLNIIAYRLVNEGGMTLDEARKFWFAVDCTMVPATDYEQLREMLPWVLRSMGMDRYMNTLERAIDATRLGNNEMPSFFDTDRAMVKLELPNNENFTDGSWVLQIVSVNTEGLMSKLQEHFFRILIGDYSQLPKSLQDILTGDSSEDGEDSEEEQSLIEALFEAFFGGDEESEDSSNDDSNDTAEDDETYNEIFLWFQQEFGEFFYSDLVAAGQDGYTIRMMSRPGRAIPMLMHLAFNENTAEPDQMVFAVYMNSRWYILTGDETDSEEDSTNFIEDLVSDLFEGLTSSRNKDSRKNLIAVNIVGGEVCEISSEGLQDFVLPEPLSAAEE